MSFSRLLHQVAAIYRATAATYDDYGNPESSWGVIAGQDAVPCRIQDGSSDEDTKDRDTISRAATGYFGADIDLQPFDRVEVDGLTWEVDGHPTLRHDATGPHHYEAALRRVVV